VSLPPAWRRPTAPDGIPHARAPRRGLVIGAGAAVGGAWALGVLCALSEAEGYDPTGCDVVVGTSAGSVLAALIGYGVEPGLMIEALTGARAAPRTPPAGGYAVAADAVDRALTDIPLPVPFPGNVRLAARVLTQQGGPAVRTAAAALAPRGRGDLAPVGELVGAFAGGRAWPAAPRTWVVAVDFDSGNRVTFGAPGAPRTSAAEAVMASCSVPGLFPPRRIGDHRYVDGGAVSVTNVDLLVHEELDEVLVLAPMAFPDDAPPRSAAGRLDRRVRQGLTRRLEEEVGRLTARGVEVRVLRPTAEDLLVMGANSFDASRRASVFDTALRTLRLDPHGSLPDVLVLGDGPIPAAGSGRR
jgi:NTE family protein